MKSRFDKALDIVRGNSVVANDRRSGDAFAIDHKVIRRRGVRIIRPSHGISYRMQGSLEALATRTDFIDGMPHYVFEVR